MNAADAIDQDRYSTDDLAHRDGYTPCPACGETVGTTTDGPCIACLEAFDAEDAA